MSGHNTCVFCGEYCSEDQMICVDCKYINPALKTVFDAMADQLWKEIKEARSTNSLSIVFCPDGSVDVRRGDTVVKNCDDLEHALAEFMKEYDR